MYLFCERGRLLNQRRVVRIDKLVVGIHLRVVSPLTSFRSPMILPDLKYSRQTGQASWILIASNS